ncbi:MAG TPA: general secretion pathway protein GspB [Gallionella sp.]|nr:general secretion pathway protein GspB [Gallionella sp.]
MSYILDALKKSDQQRQRGMTPTLPEAQPTLAAPRRTVLGAYGVFAVVLLGAGIAIGWLHPWQAERVAPADEVLAVRSAITVPRPAILAPVSSEANGNTAREWLAQNSTPGVPSSRKADIPVPPADSPREQPVISMAELPLAIRQEIPAMTIQLHAYSSQPKNRLVSINSRMLHEGELLVQDLKLEQITPDGMIFSYKGYRFQRGIR